MVLVGIGVFKEPSDTKDNFKSYHSVVVSLRNTDDKDLRENKD